VSDISDKAAIAGQTFTGDIAAPKITASTGILFGTDTAAANTLDDYEEGTWTPNLEFNGLFSGIIYSLAAGYYTKVGNSVHCIGYIDLNSKGTSTGNATISGLPFTARSAAGNNSGVTISRIKNISFSDVITGYVFSNQDRITFAQTTNAGSESNINSGNFSDSSTLMVNFSYLT
jgi:hypothetical protein